MARIQNSGLKLWDHLETKPVPVKMLTDSLPALPYTSRWLSLGRRAREEVSPTSTAGPGKAEGDREVKASAQSAAGQSQEPSASLTPEHSLARGHLSL